MLTIDVGNTRLKWAIWEKGQMTRSDECVHDGLFENRLFERCLPELTALEEVCVVNVAGKGAESALKKWLLEKSEAKLFFLKTEKKCCGVTNAYVNPSQHGVDRWAALIAAKSLTDTAVCVIDIGTAVTIDFMDDKGAHQGGKIMPGLRMMQKALTANTADIDFNEIDMGLFDFKRASEELAINTEDAVKNGTMALLRAGIEDECLRAEKRYGGNLSIFLTGGLAEKMLPLLSVPNLIHEPHLVLKGLHIAANN